MSVTKILFLGIFITSFFLTFMTPKPKEGDSSSALLQINPFFFKALSGISTNLNSDFFWLKANAISELRLSYETIQSEEFYRAFFSIALLDPNFFPAINYGVLFLASLKNEVGMAENILDIALKQSPENIDLLFLKLLLEGSYKEPRNEEQVYLLAKEIANSQKESAYINKNLVFSFARDMMLYSKHSRIQDLRWLHKNTKEQKIKEEIEKKLAALEG